LPVKQICYDQPVHVTAGSKLGRTPGDNDKYHIGACRMAADGSAAWDGECLPRPVHGADNSLLSGGLGVKRPQHGFRGWPLRKKPAQLISRYPSAPFRSPFGYVVVSEAKQSPTAKKKIATALAGLAMTMMNWSFSSAVVAAGL